MAVGLPVIVIMLVAMLTLAAASSSQMCALDAARAGARQVAIGADDSVVHQTVSQVAGDGASIEIVHGGDWVTVTVRRPVGAGFLGGGPLKASGQATAWLEPQP
jgi:hypothetical protein